jgi:hypothetical protein
MIRASSPEPVRSLNCAISATVNNRHGRDWFSVSHDVGSKTKKQCFHRIRLEVAAGRMQEPVGKRKWDLWSTT